MKAQNSVAILCFGIISKEVLRSPPKAVFLRSTITIAIIMP
ncbi:MAG: hypothetical protein ACKO7R_14920 [Pseudanabaena sp.]